MHLPENISERLDKLAPPSEEHIGFYQKLSGAWYAVAIYCIENTFDNIDHGVAAKNPKEFAAMIAAGGLTTVVGSFYYRRSWQSQGE